MTEQTRAEDLQIELAGPPEDVIEAVWARALGRGSVDRDEGFFDLGADSAMVLQVVRVLRVRWPRVQVVDVFAHPTVTRLAGFLGDG
jgi:hypothetical protein